MKNLNTGNKIDSKLLKDAAQPYRNEIDNKGRVGFSYKSVCFLKIFVNISDISDYTMKKIRELTFLYFS